MIRHVALAIALVPWACKEAPAAGGKCSREEDRTFAACESTSAALLCRDLRLESVGCKGPKGCTASGDPPSGECDSQIAAEGDRCWNDRDNEGTACTADGSTLKCVQDAELSGAPLVWGRFAAVRACRGPKGCTAGKPDYSGELCDQSLAKLGDPCDTSGHWSKTCSLDKKALLECRSAQGKTSKPDGAFVVERECPTKKGCLLATLVDSDIQVPACDFRGSKEGERCGTGNQNMTICSPDQAAILKCDPQSLTFVVDQVCDKGTRCGGLSKDPKRIHDVVECAADKAKP